MPVISLIDEALLFTESFTMFKTSDGALFFTSTIKLAIAFVLIFELFGWLLFNHASKKITVQGG